MKRFQAYRQGHKVTSVALCLALLSPEQCPATRENQGTRKKSGNFTFWKISGKEGNLAKIFGFFQKKMELRAFDQTVESKT